MFWNSSTLLSQSAILMHFKIFFPKDLQKHNPVYFCPYFSLDFSPLTVLCLALFRVRCSHCVLCPRMPTDADGGVPGCTLLSPQRANHYLPCPSVWSSLLSRTINAAWTRGRIWSPASGIPSRVIAPSTLSCLCNHWAILGP